MTEQTTLRDYLRLLSRYRLLIVAVTAAAIGLTVALSARQSTVYAASTSLQLEAQSSALSVFGTPTGTSITPAQRAALVAEKVLRQSTLEQVRQDLRLPPPAARLRSQLKATPDDKSGLLVIEARAGDAQSAAKLADTVARVTVNDEVAEARQGFRAPLKQLRARLRRLRPDNPSRIIFAERLSQLEALSSLARPASIVKEASVPDSPISPHPVRNGMIGGVLGLMFGLALAAFRDSLDRRVRGEGDLQDVLDMPIIGHVPEHAMGQAVFSANGRAASTQADLEAFRILRTNIDFLQDLGEIRSIAVTSALPEEGKSTVAASLACAYAFGGSRVLLLECDLRRPVLAKRMGVDRKPGLAEYLAGTATGPDVITTIPLDGPDIEGDGAPPDSRSLECIFAGKTPRYPTELLRSSRFAELLTSLTRTYDVVILDTSPLLLVADTLQILPHVDGVLLCTRASQTTREQASAARQVLENLPPKPAGAVMTGVKPTDEGQYGYYSYTKYGYAKTSVGSP